MAPRRFCAASLGKTGGFNEIKFDDSNGSEEMFVNAQYNRNENTNNDHTFKVGQNQSESVGVDLLDYEISVYQDRSMSRD